MPNVTSCKKKCKSEPAPLLWRDLLFFSHRYFIFKLVNSAMRQLRGIINNRTTNDVRQSLTWVDNLFLPSVLSVINGMSLTHRKWHSKYHWNVCWTTSYKFGFAWMKACLQRLCTTLLLYLWLWHVSIQYILPLFTHCLNVLLMIYFWSPSWWFPYVNESQWQNSLSGVITLPTVTFRKGWKTH